jgi:hypothetical protein
MKTECEDDSEYEFGSRASSADISIKGEEQISFPLSPSSNASPPSTPLTTWPYSALLTPHSLVTPSQLILTDIVVKRPPSSASPAEPATKKVKRKARTDEEKEMRAYERTMRNRRAAQESRDRKKRQFETLEDENRRLQEENAQMKQRIQQLESQQFNLILDPTFPVLPSTPIDSHEPVVKTEVYSPESFESTFHPAVMESDQQCLSNSMEITTSTNHMHSYNLLYPTTVYWMIVYWTTMHSLLPLFSTLFSMTTRISLMNEIHAYLLPATFNSLNTGSLLLARRRGCAKSHVIKAEESGFAEDHVEGTAWIG